MCLSDSVSFFRMYEDILKILFDLFGKMSQKCEQFSYELFFDCLWFLGIFLWVLNGPPPSVNVKVLFRGKNMENFFFSVFYYLYIFFLENNEKMY